MKISNTRGASSKSFNSRESWLRKRKKEQERERESRQKIPPRKKGKEKRSLRQARVESPSSRSRSRKSSPRVPRAFSPMANRRGFVNVGRQVHRDRGATASSVGYPILPPPPSVLRPSIRPSLSLSSTFLSRGAGLGSLASPRPPPLPCSPSTARQGHASLRARVPA